MRHLADIPYDRDVTRAAETAVAKRFSAAFATIAKQAAAAVLVSKLAKADEPDPDAVAQAIVDALDLSSLDDLEDDVASDLAPVVADSSQSAGAQLGVAVNVVNEKAVKAVNDELAPTIKGISDATRTMLRDTIADGLRRNIGLAAISDEVGDAYALSDKRAKVIAATETSRANSMSSLAGYKAARDQGTSVLKRWLAEPGCCAACSGNQAVGPIALDDAFPSGHQTPGAHPACRCAIAPSLGEAKKMDTKQRFALNKDGSTEAYDITESTLAPYYRQAEDLRFIAEHMGELVKGLRDCRDASLRADAHDTALEKGATSSLTKSCSRALAEAQQTLDRINEIARQPMPLPWQLRLAEAPPAGAG